EFSKVTCGSSSGHFIKVQNRTRVFSNEAFKHRRDQSGRDCHWTRHPDFARCWVSQAIDVANALLQLVEYSDAAVEQRLTVYRRLPSFRAPFTPPGPQRPV